MRKCHKSGVKAFLVKSHQQTMVIVAHQQAALIGMRLMGQASKNAGLLKDNFQKGKQQPCKGYISVRIYVRIDDDSNDTMDNW